MRRPAGRLLVGRRRLAGECAPVDLTGFIAVVVLNAAYLFEGTFMRLGD